ncbi:VOC family protein [Streptomyces lasalocidi]|uniref:VOC family protein n=1 Tax=Streptomyces lasalocidi TaxID=324833 RepID=A0A4U5WIP2_STRLS|nr:VOC family protein [Streptomyces lasalocidi]TKT01874.1 VOC family protein [Streptomyces lasalocidi]
MLGTRFRTGSPVWIDLGSPDTATAAAFYSAVFGWTYETAGPESSGYGVFRKGDRTVGAVGRLTERGARSAWMTYFRSDDVDATTRAVVAAGGTVRAEPMSMGDSSMAQFTDPQGAQFAVLKSDQGLERAAEDDTLLWVELHTEDPEAAIHFYSGLFGWRSEVMQAPGMTYRVLSLAEGDRQQTAFGGVAEHRGEPEGVRWVPYFAVADADASADLVRSHGGTVVMPASDVPEVGRIAWLADPCEAVFAVLKPNPRQA